MQNRFKNNPKWASSIARESQNKQTACSSASKKNRSTYGQSHPMEDMSVSNWTMVSDAQWISMRNNKRCYFWLVEFKTGSPRFKNLEQKKRAPFLASGMAAI